MNHSSGMKKVMGMNNEVIYLKSATIFLHDDGAALVRIQETLS